MFKHLILLILIPTIAFSQSKYEDAMRKNLAVMDTSQNLSSYIQYSNAFERIANAEKNKWLPYYYAAYASTVNSYTVTDPTQKQQQLDYAQMLINKADSLQPNNSEVTTVKAFVLSAMIMIDPARNGAVYGPQSNALLEKAIQQDTTNPRPYYLKGVSAYYTPPAFGGGKDKAVQLLQTSINKFATFKPENDLMPTWGAVPAKMFLLQAQKQ
jgi:hypothetical protein